MARYRMVVSDPPQGRVNADEAARHLGLTPEQFAGKAAYPVPEIWFAHPDPLRVQETAVGLQDAGCRVRIATAESLARFPARRRIRAFSFDAAGFTAHLDGSDVTVPYESAVLAVYCRPREVSERTSAARPRRSSGFLSYRDRLLESGPPPVGADDDFDDTPFLDLFVGTNGSSDRLTVVQNAVSFAGLGRVQPRAAANMEALVGNCEDRFGQTRVDRRLVGMRLRAHGSVRPPGAEHRRGFSYASPGLSALLSTVADGLQRLTQPELSSRLTYLTHRPAS